MRNVNGNDAKLNNILYTSYYTYYYNMHKRIPKQF